MPEGSVVCSGLVERIGEEMGRVLHKYGLEEDKKEIIIDQKISTHQEGLNLVADLLSHSEHGVISDVNEVTLVGHRIVHGGDRFHCVTRITDSVKDAIDELSNLAPLHNPANLTGINTAEKVFPKAIQVGVFDTAFHQSIPEVAFRYALPEKLYKENGIRLYGFHGTSHRYVSRRAAEFLGKKPEETSLITLHLGNGASMAAIKNGKSIDTSLGMSTISGLVMGTRVGDIDPGVLIYMQEVLGYDWRDVKRILNKESGLLGLSGDNDLRNISDRYLQGDEQAKLALSIYVYRIKKYIGAYIAAIGKIDAIVFTAGVGENSNLIRKLVANNLAHLGISIDLDKNKTRSNTERDLSDTNASIKTLVIPTNEEFEIARQAYALISESE